MTKDNIISSKVIYEGRAVRFRVDTIRKPSGEETTREIVEHAAAVAIVPVDDENNVLLVRQFREAIDKEILEIPAGSIDHGEDAEPAARREMQEETGFLPQKLHKLTEFYAAPGYCTEFLYIYLATDLVPGRLFAEDTEGITLVRVPVEDIPSLLEKGAICDAKSIIGLYAFMEYHRKNPNL